MELVRVTTRDGYYLDGSFEYVHHAKTSTRLVDAWLLVHGTGSNFYASGVLDAFSRQAVASGVSVLRANTRGHDGISSVHGPGKSARGGATYEHVADCTHDLQAWIEFLKRQGCARIGLCGHSMGGVKSAYFMATEACTLVEFLVLISSPRFHHQTMLEHPSAAAFRHDFELACRLVEAGRHEELIHVTQPMPFLATAAGFLDKYGPADHYDLARFLPRISCPVLYVLGTKSPGQSIGFAGLPATLGQLTAQHSHIQVSFVEGASTNYGGLEQVPFERVANWLEQRQLKPNHE